jgi:hypothetical protein
MSLFWWGGTGVWTQGFVPARPVLCHLSQTFSPNVTFDQEGQEFETTLRNTVKPHRKKKKS